jgi:hypothetical protein
MGLDRFSHDSRLSDAVIFPGKWVFHCDAMAKAWPQKNASSA